MRIARSNAGHVLALDLGTCTGWCAGKLGERPRFGQLNLASQEYVVRAAKLRNWMDAWEALNGRFTAIAVEAPLIAGQKSQAALAVTMALYWTLALWAYDAEIPLAETASQTARKMVIGRGTFPRGEAKDHVMAFCRTAGYEIGEQHNAADALVLWLSVQQATLGALMPA